MADPAPTHPDRWVLYIPDYWPPSLNKTQMAHWSRVRKHKKRALELVYGYALQQHGAIPRFEGPVKLSITRLIGYRQRRLDVDNLLGSVKSLVDALREPSQAGKGRQGGLGIIADDDPGKLDLDVDQRKNGTPDTLDWMAKVGCRWHPRMPHGQGVPPHQFRLEAMKSEATVIIIEGERTA